jgi:proteic killer suppression protein
MIVRAALAAMAIQGFKDSRLEAIDGGRNPGKRFPAELVRVTKRKLEMLQAAAQLEDLKFPPGNNLHALEAARLGQHAIRVNDQFRICFVWTDAGPKDVEFTDYH